MTRLDNPIFLMNKEKEKMMSNFLFKKNDIIEFNYKNYKGEIQHRQAVVIRIYEGVTEYHPKHQTLIYSFDKDKRKFRPFAYKDMWNIKVHPINHARDLPFLDYVEIYGIPQDFS